MRAEASGEEHPRLEAAKPPMPPIVLRIESGDDEDDDEEEEDQEVKPFDDFFAPMASSPASDAFSHGPLGFHGSPDRGHGPSPLRMQSPDALSMPTLNSSFTELALLTARNNPTSAVVHLRQCGADDVDAITEGAEMLRISLESVQSTAPCEPGGEAPARLMQDGGHVKKAINDLLDRHGRERPNIASELFKCLALLYESGTISTVLLSDKEVEHVMYYLQRPHTDAARPHACEVAVQYVMSGKLSTETSLRMADALLQRLPEANAVSLLFSLQALEGLLLDDTVLEASKSDLLQVFNVVRARTPKEVSSLFSDTFLRRAYASTLGGILADEALLNELVSIPPPASPKAKAGKPTNDGASDVSSDAAEGGESEEAVDCIVDCLNRFLFEVVKGAGPHMSIAARMSIVAAVAVATAVAGCVMKPVYRKTRMAAVVNQIRRDSAQSMTTFQPVSAAQAPLDAPPPQIELTRASSNNLTGSPRFSPAFRPMVSGALSMVSSNAGLLQQDLDCSVTGRRRSLTGTQSLIRVMTGLSRTARSLRAFTTKCAKEQALLHTLEAVRNALEIPVVRDRLRQRKAYVAVSELLSCCTLCPEAAEFCSGIVSKLTDGASAPTQRVSRALVDSIMIHQFDRSVLCSSVSCLHGIASDDAKTPWWGAIFEHTDGRVLEAITLVLMRVRLPEISLLCARALLRLTSLPKGAKQLFRLEPPLGVSPIATVAAGTADGPCRNVLLRILEALSSNSGKDRAETLVIHSVVGEMLNLLNRSSSEDATGGGDDVVCSCLIILNNMLLSSDRRQAPAYPEQHLSITCRKSESCPSSQRRDLARLKSSSAQPEAADTPRSVDDDTDTVVCLDASDALAALPPTNGAGNDDDSSGGVTKGSANNNNNNNNNSNNASAGNNDTGHPFASTAPAYRAKLSLPLPLLPLPLPSPLNSPSGRDLDGGLFPVYSENTPRSPLSPYLEMADHSFTQRKPGVVREKLLELEAHTTLFDLFRMATGRTQHMAGVLLGGMAEASHDVREAILTNGGLSAMFKLMETHRGDVELSHACGYLLACLALEGPEVCSEIAKEDGGDAVMKAAKFKSSLLTGTQRALCSERHKEILSRKPSVVHEVELLNAELEATRQQCKTLEACFTHLVRDDALSALSLLRSSTAFVDQHAAILRGLIHAEIVAAVLAVAAASASHLPAPPRPDARLCEFLLEHDYPAALAEVRAHPALKRRHGAAVAKRWAGAVALAAGAAVASCASSGLPPPAAREDGGLRAFCRRLAAAAPRPAVDRAIEEVPEPSLAPFFESLRSPADDAAATPPPPPPAVAGHQVQTTAPAATPTPAASGRWFEHTRATALHRLRAIGEGWDGNPGDPALAEDVREGVRAWEGLDLEGAEGPETLWDDVRRLEAGVSDLQARADAAQRSPGGGGGAWFEHTREAALLRLRAIGRRWDGCRAKLEDPALPEDVRAATRAWESLAADADGSRETARTLEEDVRSLQARSDTAIDHAAAVAAEQAARALRAASTPDPTTAPVVTAAATTSPQTPEQRHSDAEWVRARMAGWEGKGLDLDDLRRDVGSAGPEDGAGLVKKWCGVLERRLAGGDADPWAAAAASVAAEEAAARQRDQALHRVALLEAETARLRAEADARASPAKPAPGHPARKTASRKPAAHVAGNGRNAVKSAKVDPPPSSAGEADIDVPIVALVGDVDYFKGKLEGAINVISQQSQEIEKLKRGLRVKPAGARPAERTANAWGNTDPIDEEEAELEGWVSEQIEQDRRLAEKDRELAARQAELERLATVLEAKEGEQQKVRHLFEAREKRLRKLEKRARAQDSGLDPDGQGSGTPDADGSRPPATREGLERRIKQLTAQLQAFVQAARVYDQPSATAIASALRDDKLDPIRDLILSFRACPLSTPRAHVRRQTPPSLRGPSPLPSEHPTRDARATRAKAKEALAGVWKWWKRVAATLDRMPCVTPPCAPGPAVSPTAKPVDYATGVRELVWELHRCPLYLIGDRVCKTDDPEQVLAEVSQWWGPASAVWQRSYVAFLQKRAALLHSLVSLTAQAPPPQNPGGRAAAPAASPRPPSAPKPGTRKQTLDPSDDVYSFVSRREERTAKQRGTLQIMYGE
ncbi:hypothetical protein DIPPA_10238 [Diplonema papillatum]|nr:hypothetical protein DIPPA_10238 [Diplonema papillatum]